MSDASTTREITGDPATLPLLLKAAVGALPGVTRLPGVSRLPGVRRRGSALPALKLTRYDVPMDRGHVARYADLCGFGRKETVPVTYPHLLAFGLHLSILTDPAFPFPAIGTVHLANTITAHRAISAGERLQVTAWPADLRPHAKGRVFDLVTQVHSAGELVWEETSAFLRRGAGDDTAPATDDRLEAVPPSAIEWRLPGDLGRRYAAVSGDRNPIHLYAVTAKAFGFPHQIAHGMWSKARCLAALEGRLPDAVTIDVAFKKPVLLPGRVRLGARPLGDRGWAFSLSDPGSGAPHLLGAARALET